MIEVACASLREEPLRTALAGLAYAVFLFLACKSGWQGLQILRRRAVVRRGKEDLFLFAAIVLLLVLTWPTTEVMRFVYGMSLVAYGLLVGAVLLRRNNLVVYNVGRETLSTAVAAALKGLGIPLAESEGREYRVPSMGPEARIGVVEEEPGTVSIIQFHCLRHAAGRELVRRLRDQVPPMLKSDPRHRATLRGALFFCGGVVGLASASAVAVLLLRCL